MKKFISAIVTLGFLLSATAALAVDVNKASAEELAEALMGVGVKKAELIIKAREDKKFVDAEDLVTRVKGIGPKTVEKNKGELEF